MKISQSKVRVEPNKAAPIPRIAAKPAVASKAAAQKPSPVMPAARTPAPPKKAPMSAPPTVRPMTESFSSPAETGTLHSILASARQELEFIRRMRAEAAKYQQYTATKARSEAHQLVLNARLTTQREIEEVIRQASEEIQKVLADIRVIRITAQEELAAQRKFTDAAKLNSMSLSMKEAFDKIAYKKPRKKLESVRE
jgi:SepF-like predicted cell division protein (DUF552 family)